MNKPSKRPFVPQIEVFEFMDLIVERIASTVIRQISTGINFALNLKPPNTTPNIIVMNKSKLITYIQFCIAL